MTGFCFSRGVALYRLLMVMETLLMSEKERRRLTILSQVKSGQLTVSAAGRMLGLSERQVRCVWQRYTHRVWF